MGRKPFKQTSVSLAFPLPPPNALRSSQPCPHQQEAYIWLQDNLAAPPVPFAAGGFGVRGGSSHVMELGAPFQCCALRGYCNSIGLHKSHGVRTHTHTAKPAGPEEAPTASTCVNKLPQRPTLQRGAHPGRAVAARREVATEVQPQRSVRPFRTTACGAALVRVEPAFFRSNDMLGLAWLANNGPLSQRECPGPGCTLRFNVEEAQGKEGGRGREAHALLRAKAAKQNRRRRAHRI